MIQEIKFKLKNGMTLEVDESGFALFSPEAGGYILDASTFAEEEEGPMALDKSIFKIQKNLTTGTNTISIIKR